MELVYSNQTSIVDALAAVGVGRPVEELAMTNATLTIPTDSSDAVQAALTATEGLLPMVNKTLGALAPLCVLVGELQGAAVTRTCTRLTVAIDFIVEVLNGPPIRAGLDVNGTALVSSVCEPAQTLVATGATACANVELVAASLSAAARAEVAAVAASAASAASAAGAVALMSLQQQVVSARRA
eukprot:7386526-Prymnesium_polylepis.1